MTNATEKHAELVGVDWTTRADGLLRPPPDWGDHRAYTPSTAWDEHIRQDQAAK